MANYHTFRDLEDRNNDNNYSANRGSGFIGPEMDTETREAMAMFGPLTCANR